MIDGITIGHFSAGAVASLSVILILTGRLVPRRTVDLMHEAMVKREEQLDKLIDSLGTSLHFIEEVARTAQARDRAPKDGDPS